MICCRIARYSRFIFEECLKWASLRKAFGKPLTEQPVIRAKLAAMYAKIEAGQSWLESERTIIGTEDFVRSLADIFPYSSDITYQMCSMSYAEHAEHLAGPVA